MPGKDGAPQRGAALLRRASVLPQAKHHGAGGIYFRRAFESPKGEAGQRPAKPKKKGMTKVHAFLFGGVQDFKSEPKAAETSANDTVWVPFL